MTCVPAVTRSADMEDKSPSVFGSLMGSGVASRLACSTSTDSSERETPIVARSTAVCEAPAGPSRSANRPVFTVETPGGDTHKRTWAVVSLQGDVEVGTRAVFKVVIF